MLRDKAYSGAAIRAHLRRRQIKATIPDPSEQAGNRLRRRSRGGRPSAFDTAAHKQRNVERTSASSASNAPWLTGRYDKRLHLARDHRRRLDPDRAPSFRFMIYRTRSNRVRPENLHPGQHAGLLDVHPDREIAGQAQVVPDHALVDKR